MYGCLGTVTPVGGPLHQLPTELFLIFPETLTETARGLQHLLFREGTHRLKRAQLSRIGVWHQNPRIQQGLGYLEQGRAPTCPQGLKG